ncbi:ferritin family protein [Chloroflexota bacterium]
MDNEQEKTMEALKTAIQMEIDGKEYYTKACQQSGNQLGRDLLKSLAAEEDVHHHKFEEIFQDINSKREWPEVDFKPDGGKRLRTIMAAATGDAVKKDDTELAAIREAMKMEIKTHEYYSDLSKNASFDAEREFYEKVAIEEREHHLILVDYYEYLEDPAGWFVKSEHSSLDGG